MRGALLALLGGAFALLDANTVLGQEAQAPEQAAPEPAATSISSTDAAEAAALTDGIGDISSETIDELIRAHAAYVEAGNPGAALQAAALLREVHEERYGADSFEALPYVKLHAFSYKRLNDDNNARRVFERAIALTERYEGLYSFSLVYLLSNLAEHLEALDQDEAAESALLRAKFITHRRLGINNLEQVEVLRLLSDFYARGLSFEKSEREQGFMLRIHERKFGEMSPELVPALYEYANYYIDIGDFQSALPVFRRALEILEESYGEDDLRLVEPLRGIALTYTKRNYFRGEGRRSLDRAISLFEGDEYADVTDFAEFLLIRGDWHLQSNSPGEAVANYRQAWQVIAQADGDGARAKALLGQPQQVEYVKPFNVYPDYRSRAFLSPDNYLEVSFTVNAEGKVTRARVTDSTATRRTENETLSAIRAAHFRPAFVDGEPVATEMTMRQYFRPRNAKK
ncbi:MAG: TonB family protein [Pseudomonadota bacterium]